MAIGMWLTAPLLIVASVVLWAYDVHDIPLYITVPVGIAVLIAFSILLDRHVLTRRTNARPRK